LSAHPLKARAAPIAIARRFKYYGGANSARWRLGGHGDREKIMTLAAAQSASLPLLDLRHLDASGRERADFLDDLRRAARDIGFFYLVGHGVEARENAAILDLARAFFALPEAWKLAVEMVHSPHFRGYARAGAEITRGGRDWREQFDINSEREALWRSGDPAWMRLQGPNQWPPTPPQLRAALLGWQSALTKVAVRLLRAFAESLGQSPDVFEPACKGGPNQHVKIIRYPGGDPASRDPASQDGVWIGVEPRQDAFVVNIGELLELASNGYLRATIHRVVAPPPGAERFSAAFFLGAAYESTIPFLDLPPALAAEAKGPASDPENPLFQHAGTNYLKGRLRSHPDVARRHYADLIEAMAER
jgi:isopenicillin N synthase-like dioxygenase